VTLDQTSLPEPAATSVPNASRAGERKRQIANRERRDKEALAEAASKRQRIISEVDEAATPAAALMARMRARVLAKQLQK
jgi:hypothetical protein